MGKDFYLTPRILYSANRLDIIPPHDYGSILPKTGSGVVVDADAFPALFLMIAMTCMSMLKLRFEPATPASPQTKISSSLLRPRVLFPALGVLFWLWCVPAATAQKGPSAAPSNRFLFIVDTSAGMERHAPAVLKAVTDIVRSSASGQLHAGDTLGVWTFNAEVYTGQLPLQIWSPEDREEIALRIGEFLRQQHYGKSSRLDAALASMFEVVKNSDIITVFMVSDGKGTLRGTPFNQEINAICRQDVQDMKDNPMPIVIVLQAKAGRINKYTVNALPWPVVIPEVPIPIKLASVPGVQPSAVASAQSVAKTNLPIVVPAPAQSTAPPPVAAAQPQNSPPPPAVPALIPLPTRQPRNDPGLPQPSNSLAVIVQTPKPLDSSPAPAKPLAVDASLVASPSVGAPIVAAKPASLPEHPQPQSATLVNPPVKSITTPEPPGKRIQTAQNEPPENAKTETKADTSPLPSTNSAPTQAAATVPPGDAIHPNSLLIVGVTSLVIAVGLIILLVFRSRPPSSPSLITQTLGNPRK